MIQILRGDEGKKKKEIYGRQGKQLMNCTNQMQDNNKH